MSPTLHEIDPKGDTLLILRNANAPFAVLPPSPDEIPQKEQSGLAESPTKEPHDPDNEPEVRMRLSIKHLALASVYFEKLTANDWKETAPEDGYSYVVHAKEWDEEALLILMNIIHGRTAKVPETVTLEMFAKISVLVDYYQCHEAVGFFAKTWIKGLSIFSSLFKGRDTFLRLSIAWVFSEAGTFQLLTKTIIQESKTAIDSLGLPIPQGVIDALNERRQDIVSGLVLGLHDLKTQLCENEGPCSYECSSMRLGILSKSMFKMGILDPHPNSPYLGLGALALEKAIRSINEPSSKSSCPSMWGQPLRTAELPKPRTTPSSGGLFGPPIPVTSGLFGSPPAENKSSPSSGGLFASPPAENKSPPSSGLLGSSPTTVALPFCRISAKTETIINKQVAKMGGLPMQDFVNPSF